MCDCEFPFAHLEPTGTPGLTHCSACGTKSVCTHPLTKLAPSDNHGVHCSACGMTISPTQVRTVPYASLLPEPLSIWLH